MKKLGLIGYSNGNGHPFSFSAIINGFDSDYFDLNPVKPINNYLENQEKTKFDFHNLEVTHVWTEEKRLSTAISKYSKINNVVSDYKEMLGEVDAVFILRDDRHWEIASFFLEKNIFVFIDKPLALNSPELQLLMPFVRSGLLMSCSGLRFFPGTLSLADKVNKENLIPKFAVSICPNNWFNYGIHCIEGLHEVIGSDVVSVQFVGDQPHDSYRLNYQDGFYHFILLEESYQGGIISNVFFENHDPVKLEFNNNFDSFRNTILIIEKQMSVYEPILNPKDTERIIQTLIAGEESKNLNGRKINL